MIGPRSQGRHVDDGSRPAFAVFLATAPSISAIPVIVRILIDQDAFDRPFGQLTVVRGVAVATSAMAPPMLRITVRRLDRPAEADASPPA